MKITGEYWIIDGRADFADSDVSEKNHELIAVEHVCSQHLENIYQYAQELNIKTTSLVSLEENPSESVQSLLELILKKLFQMPDPSNPNLPLYKNDVQIWSEIEKRCGFDNETLMVMMNNNYNLHKYSRPSLTIDPRLYVMKRDGWIAVRNNNIEIYGLDQNKLKDLSSGIDDIIEQETGWAGEQDDEIKDENIEFNLFDHKNNKSIDVNLKDIKEKNLFRPQTLPQTTYNRPLPLLTGKQHGRELWRGTSESFSSKILTFEEWLIDNHPEMLEENWRRNAASLALAGASLLPMADVQGQQQTRTAITQSQNQKARLDAMKRVSVFHGFKKNWGSEFGSDKDQSLFNMILKIETERGHDAFLERLEKEKKEIFRVQMIGSSTDKSRRQSEIRAVHNSYDYQYLDYIMTLTLASKINL
jgi:hypothetical protein